jgi:hypothetical protein
MAQNTVRYGGLSSKKPAIAPALPLAPLRKALYEGNPELTARPAKWCFDPQRGAATGHLITSAAAASAAIDNARGMAKILVETNWRRHDGGFTHPCRTCDNSGLGVS